jgi:hypothetical protein
VAVPPFSNPTAEAGAEALFTEALRLQLSDAGQLGDADAPVQAVGELGQISGGPGAYATDRRGVGQGFVSYRVAASACVTLREGQKQLARTCVAGDEDYRPSTDPLGIEEGRRLALRRLATRLMHEALDGLSQGF